MLNDCLNNFIGVDLLYQWNSNISVYLNGTFPSSLSEEAWRKGFRNATAGQKHKELRFLLVYCSAWLNILDMLFLVIQSTCWEESRSSQEQSTWTYLFSLSFSIVYKRLCIQNGATLNKCEVRRVERESRHQIGQSHAPHALYQSALSSNNQEAQRKLA